MTLNRIHQNIREAVEEAQGLIDSEFSKCNDRPPAGSALDQEGLRDGKDIVLDYLSRGEAGAALEHLIFMVQETGIPLSKETRDDIRNTASAIQLDGTL